MNKTVTVIIPVFNEINYIETILKRVNHQKKKFNIQIIVSDDASNDGTYDFLLSNKNLYDKLIRSINNEGKGAAIRKAADYIKNDITIIQDADLEYNPEDYEDLLKPFIDLDADVVYGNRFSSKNFQRVHMFTHKIANTIITNMTNLFTNVNFSDVETGYKCFKTKILKSIKLRELSFGFEIEITKKICKLQCKIFEVPISYNGRSYSEGKKIKLKDALRAFYCILRY
jgi:glycosyltransferase involved in cell wall biosynthesis